MVDATSFIRLYTSSEWCNKIGQSDLLGTLSTDDEDLLNAYLKQN